MAITCPTCGRANDDDARFCAACGAELPGSCPSCGATLSPEAVFCLGCGKMVGRAGARPAPAPVTTSAVDETQIEPRPNRPGGAGAAAAPTGVAGDTPRSPTAPPGAPSGAPQGPPPAVPPPPAPASPGGGARRSLPVWLIVALVVIAVAAAAAVAVVLIRSGGDEGDDHASTSPSPPATTSPSASASASASPSPSVSPTTAPGFPMAVAGGAKGNILSLLSAEGEITPLSDPLGDMAYQVSWSPDGRRLACVAGAWNGARLWIADIDAGSLSEVVISTPAVVAVDSVAWLSPTELLVAGFTVKPTAQGEVAELVVYDAGSSTVVGPLQDGSGTSLRGVSVSSSADGSRVAYVTYTDQKTNAYDMPTATERLELLDRTAGSVTELGTGKAYFDVNARRFDEPLISPDGQAIIYRAAGSDVGTSYTVVDANGSTIMRSKELSFPAGYAWDPAGQKVVFTGHSIRGTGGENDPAVFYVFDRTLGGKPRTIAKYKGIMVQDLSWSPDGASIAFAEYDRDDYDTGNVYQLDATGGDADRLVSGALSPAYRPTAPGP